MYVLYNAGIVIAFYLLDLIVFRGRYFVFLSIYALIKFIPELALSVRRLHDIDKSGYHLLWGLVPIIGSIYLIALYCRASTPGTNQYGTSPASTPSTLSMKSYAQQPLKVTTSSNSPTITDDIRSKWGGSSTPSTTNTSSSVSAPLNSNNDVENIRKKW